MTELAGDGNSGSRHAARLAHAMPHAPRLHHFLLSTSSE
ncbi:hypothetical protein X749_30530 [Mesorhizobium sp. LNJC391B00]|nr:hypothetical protein X749_30530 [Mesorhizobium sp. LNJC391B00]